MSRKLSDEEIRQMTFGRFDSINKADAVSETDAGYSEPVPDAEYDIQEEYPKAREEKTKKNKKQCAGGKREKKTAPVSDELQPLWTGQTTAVDIIAPSSVDNGSRDYIVVDGIYHAYLYIAGYGYRTRNEAAWLSTLVEADDNIGLSFSFRRMQRDKILSRIAKKTMINRSKMREVADTRSDFEELDSAINSGMYIKEAMNRDNQ
ncbi:MAG: hypothetical protein ACI4A5_07755, partial [Hominilimicola sp.]